MKRITPAQRIVGETPYHSAGYIKPTAILLLLLGSAFSGKAQTIYVLNGINVGGNYGNHESTIGDYTAAGVPVKTALVTVPGADMESIALAESLTMNGVPGPKLFVADLNNQPAVTVSSPAPARLGNLTNSSVARIGMETISNGSVFNGSIDEVEFFNGRAVTYSEWQSIYDAGTYGKCKQMYFMQ